MNHNMSRIAYPVKWKILENFYKGIENGCEKVEKMKQYCNSEEVVNSFGRFHSSNCRFAEINKEFLSDRQRKLNDEFQWTEENINKFVQLDQHIRELEYKMYQKFVQIKQDLDNLVEQGHSVYREYQVEAKIDYDLMLADNNECEPKFDWICGLLQDYADWSSLEWYSFGEGQEPKDPRNNEEFIFEAWGEWLKYEYFVKNGMSRFLCNLIEEDSYSLYSYSDIVNMDLRYFSVAYNISL